MSSSARAHVTAGDLLVERRRGGRAALSRRRGARRGWPRSPLPGRRSWFPPRGAAPRAELKTSVLTTLPSSTGATAIPAGRAQQRDVLRLGLAAQRFQRVLAAEAEFLLDGAALQVIVVGGEGCRQRVGELVDGERHLLGERLGRPSRQLQGAKPAGGIERADVDPVGWALRLGRRSPAAWRAPPCAGRCLRAR